MNGHESEILLFSPSGHNHRKEKTKMYPVLFIHCFLLASLLCLACADFLDSGSVFKVLICDYPRSF